MMPPPPPPPPQKSSETTKTVYYSTVPERRDQHFWLLPFPKKYNYVCNDHSPDIIGVYEKYRIVPRIWGLYRMILRTRWRYGYKPVLYTTSTDHEYLGRFISSAGADFKFSCQPTTERGCHWHYMLGNPGCKSIWEALLPDSVRDEYREQLLNRAKTRFCSFIYSDGWRPYTFVRRDFCQLLSQYKRVDCPGTSLNNMRRLVRLDRPGGYEAKLDFMASCKFSIVFEHSADENYLTEKLPDALYAGSVPIYWGCPRVAEYYNPAAFINCYDYKSFEDVVQRVIEIDNDPRLYEEYRNAPPILPTTRYYEMMREMEEQCAAMLEEVMVRRTWKRNVLYDGLRLCWWVLVNLDWEIKTFLYRPYKKFHLRKVRLWFRRNVGSIFASR